jgi:hypothetical protein
VPWYASESDYAEATEKLDAEADRLPVALASLHPARGQGGSGLHVCRHILEWRSRTRLLVPRGSLRRGANGPSSTRTGLVCDPFRRASRKLARALLGRADTPFPVSDRAAQHSPLRLRRNDPTSISAVKRTYAAYERAIRRAALPTSSLRRQTSVSHRRRADPDPRCRVPGGVDRAGRPLQEPAQFALLRDIPNVHIRPPAPRSAVTGLIGHAQVGLVPHVRSALTGAMRQLNLYEYLAGGLPVVAVDLPGIAGISDRVLLVPPGGEMEGPCAAHCCSDESGRTEGWPSWRSIAGPAASMRCSIFRSWWSSTTACLG